MFSKAEVQPSRARLIIDCKEAPESEADLRHPKCRSAVLGHLEHEFGVESVILSHYVERQYGPRAMEALRRILALAGLPGLDPAASSRTSGTGTTPNTRPCPITVNPREAGHQSATRRG